MIFYFMCFMSQVNIEYKKISKFCDPQGKKYEVGAEGIRPIKPPSVPSFK